MLEAKVTLSPKTAHKILSSCMVTGGCHHISYIRRQFHDITMIFLPVFLYNSFLFLTFAIMKLRTEEEYVAQDIRGFLEKSVYEGWREVIPGKHPETAFFAYFSRELGGKAYLCVRKIKNTGLFKPYAIIDQKTFDAEIQNLQK